MLDGKKQSDFRHSEGQFSIAAFSNAQGGFNVVLQKSWQNKKTNQWERQKINLFDAQDMAEIETCFKFMREWLKK